MPVVYDQNIELKISAKTEGGAEVDTLAGKFDHLADAGSKIRLLEGAQAHTQELNIAIEQTRQKVQSLNTAISEAYNAGGDKTLINSLARQLTVAEREATRLDVALEKNGLSVARLRLAAREAGVDLSKIGDESFRIQKTAQDIAAVQGAFNTLHVRPAAAIEAEINAINQALRELASRTNVSGAEFDRAFAAGQAQIQKLRSELQGTSQEVQSVGRHADTLIGIMGRLGLAFSGLELAREFIKANVVLDSTTRALTQLTGSGAAAAEEIDYIRAASNRLGIELEVTSRSYMSILAAAKGTPLEGKKARDIFEAIAGSMAKLGKSSADTEGALEAVTQMMGKGTVSMEEMRQQLAERLPGAMQATADATGMTVSELIQMISSGQVLASDLLPKMADGLQKMYGTKGDAEGAVASWNRFKNSINETATTLGQNGIGSSALDYVTWAIHKLNGGIDGLNKAWNLMRAEFSNYGEQKAAAHEWEQFLKNSWNALREFIDGVRGKNKDLKKELDPAASAQKKLAEAGDAAAQSARNQAPEWLSVVNAYSKVSMAAKQATLLAEKSATAMADESKASLDLAQSFGNETEKREAGLVAARNNSAALETLAQAKRLEAEVSNSNAIALAESAKGEATLTEEKRKAIETAGEAAAVKKQEADQATAIAVAAQQHAAQLEAESEAVRDNSGRVQELSAAYQSATQYLQAVQAARAAGTVTAQQLTDAEIAAGKAAYLYRDALHDQTQAIESNAAIKQAGVNVEMATIRLAIEQQRSILAVARAQGDEYGATQALLSIKRLEIQLAELTAKAKLAEADAAFQIVKAKRAELEAAGQLTAAKEAELKAQEAGARVKQIEGKIAGETASRMRQLADAYQISGDSAGRSISQHEEFSASMRNVASSARDAASAVSDLDQYERNKFKAPVNDGGFLNGGHQASTQLDITAMMYKRGASIEEAKAAQKYYGELYQRNASAMLTGNLGNAANAARVQNYAVTDALDKSIEYARQEQKTGQAIDLGTSVADILAKKLATANTSMDYSGSAGSSHKAQLTKEAALEAIRQPQQKTVRVILDAGKGKTAELTAGSESDVNDFLKVLEQAKGRASKR